MADSVYLDIGQGVQAASGVWYKNLQTLGIGGNAATFLVVATSGRSKGIPFAMKVFRRFSKPERRDSFLQEIQFLKSCNHPSVMRVFDDGVLYEKSPFVVAEYLPNTLHATIRAGGVSTAAKACYTLQLLSALDYLATLSPPVLHRDIKPQNVFIKGRSCVLGDFGLMKHVNKENADDQELVKESVGVGMPFRYRTPDLVEYLRKGVPPTCKSDVFQVGLVVAELFTGWNPQRPAKSFTDEIEHDSLQVIPGAMAPGIGNLIAKMLTMDPMQRPSAGALLDPWQGVFLDAAKRTHALEGKVF
jgi:serine/threonine protein kinase